MWGRCCEVGKYTKNDDIGWIGKIGAWEWRSWVQLFLVQEEDHCYVSEYCPLFNKVIAYLKLEDSNNLLMVATDDSLIRAFYYNGNQFVPMNPMMMEEPTVSGGDANQGSSSNSANDIKILRGKQPQYCMAWDEVHQMLYRGQRDGMINVWNLRSVLYHVFFDLFRPNP